MKTIDRIIFIIVAISLLGIFSTLFIKKIEIKDVNNKYFSLDEANLKDREKGICADMYKEGFNWGYAQFCVQSDISENIENKSKEEVKDILYKMASQPCYQVK